MHLELTHIIVFLRRICKTDDAMNNRHDRTSGSRKEGMDRAILSQRLLLKSLGFHMHMYMPYFHIIFIHAPFDCFTHHFWEGIAECFRSNTTHL